MSKSFCACLMRAHTLKRLPSRHGAAAQVPRPEGHDESCVRSRAWPGAASGPAAASGVETAPTPTPSSGACTTVQAGDAVRQQGTKRDLKGQPEHQAAEEGPQVGRVSP